MSNSVVKVMDMKDEEFDDSLLLLVGEDGTVTPDQATVETFLRQRSGPTNLQVMKINRSEKQAIDITVDNVTYLPDIANEEVVRTEVVMDDVARNLYNFKLDHDYTPLTSPRSSTHEDEDELAKTLSILDGPDHNNTVLPLNSSEPPPLIMTTPTKQRPGAKIKLIQSITLTPANKSAKNLISPKSEMHTPVSSASFDSPVTNKTFEAKVPEKVVLTKCDLYNVKNTETPSVHKLDNAQRTSQIEIALTPLTSKPTAKIIKSESKSARKSSGPKLTKPTPKIVKESIEESEGESEEFDFEIEDDENDSDFDFEQEVKNKQPPKRITTRSKSGSQSTVKSPRTRNKNKDKLKTNINVTPTSEQVSDKILDKPAEKEVLLEQKSGKVDPKGAEKKPIPRKKKEVPKPVLDDFALFSTPDIIRRVGGKEPTTPGTGKESTIPGTGKEPTTPISSKEVLHQRTDPGSTTKPAKISESTRTKSADSFQSPTRSNRNSIDNKNDKEKMVFNHHHEHKFKEKKTNSGDKTKRISTDERNKEKEGKQEKYPSDIKRTIKTVENILNTDEIPSAEDIRSIIMNEDTKSFTTGSLSIDNVINNTSQQNLDPNNLNLDTGALDLDPTILDNLNNDELSEDILYQVAQSLVSNPELQNAIDKGINEGVLDPTGGVHHNVLSNHNTSVQCSADVIQKGTQIVRPDGRIVVIPPIERPSTRSRNKRKEETKPVFKPGHKPLDEEHVSGNELDSSNEEEESEDDPNKLWCICNQPHNNRFMICCDTCEEWYHGKCVNITKAMGQQMESEGKEWICLFCKDPMLKRPQAAARRVRKASRNSRASTDSSSSATKREDAAPSTVPCVVCQKTARKNSIYCSEACILTHAQGIERVVVFERATGKMLTGNKAPSAANLDQWLKDHVGYEVLRSGGKVVTAKPGVALTQSKLKIVKNANNHGVSLMVQKKGVNVGVLKHSPIRQTEQQQSPPLKISVSGTKNVQKNQTPSKEPRTKLIQPRPITKLDTVTPTKQKSTQNNVIKSTPPVTKPKETKPSKEKTVPKTPKPKPKEEPTKEQPKQQEDIRENVQKTISEQLTNRLKSCTDLKLTDEEVKNISVEIETQLFKYFGDTSQKYRNKYRSLIFNIKDAKNQTLWRRICEKAISAFDLVRLSPDDLASQELAMWREREAKHQLDMIKKSELELLNCNRQYVLKTHKGEQVVEDDRGDKVDNTEVIKSLTEGSTLNAGDVKHDSKDRDKKGSSKHSHKDKIKDKDRDKDKKSNKDKDHRSRRSSSRERSKDRARDSRKRSKSRDRRHLDHKKHSRSKDRDKSKHRKSAHKSSRHKKDVISSTDKLDKKSKEILEQLVDNKIVPPLEDRLWKHVPQEDIFPGKAVESDSDHEPTSTVTIPTPPRSQDDEFLSPIDLKNEPVSPEKEKYPSELERSTSPPPKSKPAEIWRGVINMIDVAQISITAHEVSGDCSGLSRELSDNLDIVGRISPDTVWEYIGKMKCSNSKGISLIRLIATNIEEKMPYLALYSYLSSRDRLGVVKSLNKAVKDFYIYPLAPQKPIPQVLLPLNGPGFEESRPALLLGIIVRDKRKRPNMEIPSLSLPKKTKIETIAPLQTTPVSAAPPPLLPRSYTPPPQKDPRLKLPPPPLLTADVPPVSKDDEGDEPYSPGDSSPDMPLALTDPPPPPPILQNVNPPVVDPSSSYTPIPALPSSTQEIQRQMEELNKKIEMQKSEITSMTQNIVSASTEIGTSALANIALPSNLQQILDSIKTIGETNEHSSPKELSQTDLTIPLMIPKTFTPRATVPPKPELPKDTIPLKLPSKPKIKPPSVNSPLLEEKVSTSVLGSLTEEDLIKKAAEMLGEDDNSSSSSRKRSEIPPLPRTPPKRLKMDVTLPPVPGLEDDIL